MKKFKGRLYYNNHHSCFLLQYHLVLVTKYRNKVLQGNIKEHVYQTIRTVCEDRDYNILEMNGEEDHIHLLFEARPGDSLVEFINVLKTKTARFVRRDLPEEVKKYYWKPYFWTDGYFITTVSENTLSAVENYIRNQGN